jgi:hypothetical protein
MGLSLSGNKTLLIETSVVTLRGGQPILNGVPLEGWTCEVLDLDSEQIELRYTSASLGGSAFRLQASPSESQNLIWMQYWIEGVPQDLILDSFGLHCEQVENVIAILRV